MNMLIRNKRKLLFLAICVIFISANLYAQLYQYQTKNLRIVTLGRMSDFLVPHSLRCYENSLVFNKRMYEWTPWEHPVMFIYDMSDYANASAGPLPWVNIRMEVSPQSYVFETALANERINSLLSHEMIHVVTLDKAASSDRFYRSLFFGKVPSLSENPITILYNYLTTPRMASTRWYKEGIAVFWETWNAGGLGRALNGYDEMFFRTWASEGRELFDVMTVEAEGTAIDFQGGAISYMYGTRFTTYLTYRYGPQKVIDWTNRSDDSKAYFVSQFEQVYGTSLEEEWNRWIDFEKKWQRANLDSIKLSSLTVGRPLSQRALGSVSRAFYDSTDRHMYAAVRYPGQVASLVSIDMDQGTFKTLTDIKKAALFYASSVAYDPHAKILYFTTDHAAYRDLNSYDVNSGESKLLLEDARIGDIVYNQIDSSLWGVRHDMGFSTIVRIPYPYTQWNQIFTLTYGKDIFDLDVSHDGSLLVASLADILGRQKLVLFDIKKLMAGDKTYIELFDFEYNTPSNFVFTKDDKLLYGSSYYTGVSNVYRYAFDTKSMDIITNCETGYFRPIPYSRDSLIVFRYSSEGFIPALIEIKPPEKVGAIQFLGQAVVEKHPIVKQWKLDPPSPKTVNVDSLIQSSGEYSPLANIKLSSLYPVVEGYKDFVAYGVRLNFYDLIILHAMDLTLSYTPNLIVPPSERFHAAYNYKFFEWTLSADYNKSQFYDLFGPTKTTHKGYSLSVQYKKYLLFDDPRSLDLTLAAKAYGDLEQMPEYQNVQATFDRYYTLRGSLTYKFFNKSIGAVDDEKGVRVQLISRNNYVRSTFIPRVQTNLDYGIALPVDHSSIWLRSSFGYSFGERLDPFANFYFGGFGNNWVDYLEPKRYREDYSFPGIEIDAAGGTNYGKLMLEWALPPLRFRNFGTLDFYCNWARFALFSSVLSTNLDNNNFQQTLFNLGSQVDFRIAFLSSFECTFSLGYAFAFQRGQDPTKEFMISLRIQN